MAEVGCISPSVVIDFAERGFGQRDMSAISICNVAIGGKGELDSVN